MLESYRDHCGDLVKPMTIIQEVVSVQESMHALRSWGHVSLLAFAFTFAENEEPAASQQSATALCEALRRHVRASDEVFLLDHSASARAGLFFVLPEADADGCQVVQERLQKHLVTALLTLDETLPRPQRVETRAFSSICAAPTLQLREHDPARELALGGLQDGSSENGVDGEKGIDIIDERNGSGWRDFWPRFLPLFSFDHF